MTYSECSLLKLVDTNKSPKILCWTITKSHLCLCLRFCFCSPTSRPSHPPCRLSSQKGEGVCVCVCVRERGRERETKKKFLCHPLTSQRSGQMESWKVLTVLIYSNSFVLDDAWLLSLLLPASLAPLFDFGPGSVFEWNGGCAAQKSALRKASSFFKNIRLSIYHSSGQFLTSYGD